MEQNNLAEVQSQPDQSMPTQTAQTEKLVPQSQMNEVVGLEKQKSYEKGKRDALMSMQMNSAQQNQTSQVMPGNTMPAGGSFDEERARNIAAEQFQKMQSELMERQQNEYYNQQGQRIAQEFQTKLDSGKHNYDDFDTVMQDLDLRDNPHIVALGNSVDNTADVIYELAQNPMKVANLEILMRKNPRLAQKEMLKLSDSIKKNQAAKQEKQPNEPLSQIQPTPIAADNGSTSLKDLKQIYRG